MATLQQNSAPTVRLRLMSDASQAESNESSAQKSPTTLIYLFLVSLALPMVFFVGPIRLSPYRLVLILMFVPVVVFWLSGRCGQIRSFDIFFFLFACWAGLALVVNHGLLASIEGAAIVMIETAGSFLLARYLVRDEHSFEAVGRCLFLIVVLLSPFAVYELITAQPIILQVFGKVFTVAPNVVKEARWGLDRVQGPFEHPILFGVFCMSGLGLAIYVQNFKVRGWKKIIRPAAYFLMVACSLSSGPLSALLGQMGIILWERCTRAIVSRWKIFLSGISAAYVVVDLASNRTPLEVFIAYTAFNPVTAYSRINIWHFGSAEVKRHPLFGIGLNDWVRPYWMTDSIDMFWLLPAMTYGLPASLFFVSAVLIIIIQLGRLQITDPKLRSYRLGIVITLCGLALAGWSVHFWNATYCLFMFLLGCGGWMIERKNELNTVSQATKRSHRSKGRKRLAHT